MSQPVELGEILLKVVLPILAQTFDGPTAQAQPAHTGREILPQRGVRDKQDEIISRI
jgi:hypothetical protein